MKIILYTLSALFFAYVLWGIGTDIYHGIDDTAYWRGVRHATEYERQRCYNAHAKALGESMDDLMKWEMSYYERKYEGMGR